ncbi:hypothetical protein GSI_08213 [Ganoderma sinense ZZ0214-1]|uniref:Uncharacterized protein n=1 Tax=Ganoderma sinense ZZ0214-1 TaxID=1077348 RepID=A0A2G8S773_9APHY|nr:hypothetical protein GSI_08213 [Ganoderma sinense ZZ0214-1]
MLKRQRSSTSFVPDSYAPQESSIDMSERAAKRMRHLPSPQSQVDKDKALWRAGWSDGEEDVDVDELINGPSAPFVQARRLQHAGEYKHVNSLLHDLHAEQRHRMLFSTTSSSTQLPPISHWRPHIDDYDHPIPSPPNKLAPVAPPYPQPQHESQGGSTSFMISIPSKDVSLVDHIEVQRVTQQYENTNRYVRTTLRAILSKLIVLV